MATSDQAPRLGGRHSLRVWLPWVITALVIAPLAISVWLADRMVDTTLLRSAGNRAQRAADRIADLLDRQGSLEQLRAISNDAALKQFLQTPTDATRQQAMTRLRQFSGASLRRIQLWDANGALALEVAGDPSDAGASDDPGAAKNRLPRDDKPTTEGVGPLQAAGDIVFSDTVAAIHGERAPPAGAEPLGYFRLRVTFVETPPGIFSRLVGEDAVIRVGNRAGGLWSDLTSVVPPEQVDLSRRGVQTFRTAAGDSQLGAVSLVNGTPWAVWVGFPVAAIIAPASEFARDLIAIAFPFIVAAALFSVWLAFSITRPLTRINAAAAAVAAGNFSERVSIARRDELGQLSRAFDAMAADVQAKADALQKSEARFRDMAENMPHIVWTAQPDGRRDYFNHHWFDYTALTIDDTLGEGWRRAVHPDDLDGLIERWECALRDGDKQAARYRVRRHDGEYRWHAGRASPLRNDHGRITMWVGTMTDIEDVLRAEEDLRRLNEDLERRVQTRTAELESANRELEAFSSSVSHDLRAPLRHVQGYVEMLTESAGDQLSGDSHRYLKTIRDATIEMGDLIDGLLAFSRIGRVAMAESRVPLDQVVQSVIKALDLETRGRTIDWRIEPLPVVDGDAAMLKQVYANLIANAVKYTGRREHAVIEIGCRGEAEGRAVLFVRDNGAGFDMRYVHKLFGVFQRLHGSDEFEGTGIGLATVRRIVTRHGGRVWAEGEPGAGATFFLTLQLSAVN